MALTESALGSGGREQYPKVVHESPETIILEDQFGNLFAYDLTGDGAETPIRFPEGEHDGDIDCVVKRGID